MFESVRIARNVDGVSRDVDDRGLSNLAPARAFRDYQVEIDRESLPKGVEIREIL